MRKNSGHKSNYSLHMCKSLLLGENLRISMALSKQNMQSRFIIDEFDKIRQLVDTPNNTIQGFIVNMDCYQIASIFPEVDHGTVFRDNNLWLFVDNNIDSSVIETLVCFTNFFLSIKYH